MAKKILFILLTLISGILFAQPGALNQKDAQGRKQGKWKKLDENGKLKYEGVFRDDHPEGTFTYYYPTGEVKAICEYSHQGVVSKTRYFHPNGKVQGEGIYVEEKKDSIWNFYDDKGSLLSSEFYVNNIKWGKSQTFYPKAGLCEDAIYENGMKNGPFSSYFENGKTKETGLYKNDKRMGVFMRYHSNGNLAAEGAYEDGKMVGEWTYYTEDGQPSFSETIVKGEKTNMKYYNGTFSESYPDNIPKFTYTYLNKKKHGPFVEYYHKGQYKLVPKKAEKGMPAEMEEVLTGQVLKARGNYLNDVYDGKIYFYKETGELDHTEEWKDGQKIK